MQSRLTTIRFRLHIEGALQHLLARLCCCRQRSICDSRLQSVAGLNKALLSALRRIRLAEPLARPCACCRRLRSQLSKVSSLKPWVFDFILQTGPVLPALLCKPSTEA